MSDSGASPDRDAEQGQHQMKGLIPEIFWEEIRTWGSIPGNNIPVFLYPWTMLHPQSRAEQPHVSPEKAKIDASGDQKYLLFQGRSPRSCKRISRFSEVFCSYYFVLKVGVKVQPGS